MLFYLPNIFINRKKYMQSSLIKFPVVSFRRIESPFDETIAKTYIAVVKVADLPAEIEKWRKINPRDPKLTSGVSNKIRKSLENNPDQFLFRNRGITLLVEKAGFNNQTSELALEFSEPSRHGLLDGGHTYRVLRDFVESTDETEKDRITGCVRFEIIEGIENLDDAVEIVHARNTSAQVKSESLEELQQHFEGIKKALSEKTYANRIAYKEYEVDDSTGEVKDVDIKDILSYFICFDVESFTNEKHPILSYSQKSQVVEHFRNHRERLERYLPLLPKILELRDDIYERLPEAYNEQGGKFGGLNSVVQIKNRPKMSSEELVFKGSTSSYRIPSAFIYPILAAFRNLVRIKDGRAEWKDNPTQVFHSMEQSLAASVCGQAKTMSNPTKLGKDGATWKLCYDAVRIQVLERGLN